MTLLQPSQDLPYISLPERFAFAPGPFLAQMYDQHGPIFRAHLFGREVIYMVGPEANRFILSTHRQYFSHHEGWGKLTGAVQLLGDGLITMDGSQHDQHRQMMHPAFTLTFMEHYLPIMQRHIHTYINRWLERGEVDIHTEMRKIAFAILAETLAGLSTGSEVVLFQELFTSLLNLGRGGTPEQGILGRSGQVKQALYELLQPKIQARREYPTDDILGILVQARTDDGQMLTDEQLIAHINFLVGTGHETTSSLGAWALYLLARHPAYLGRVIDEQAQIVPAGKDMTLDDLKRMTALDLALSEAERLYPPLDMGPRGVVTAFEFHGYQIPVGSFVCYAIAATHLISSIFANPLVFDPDRFLPPREEHKKTAYALVGFGGGPRICIATNYVNVALKALLSTILGTYRLEVLSNQEPVQFYRGIGMPLRGLRLHIARL